MDMLLSSFVKNHIDNFDNELLEELEKFLEFEDEVILNFYPRAVSSNLIHLG